MHRDIFHAIAGIILHDVAGRRCDHASVLGLAVLLFLVIVVIGEKRIAVSARNDQCREGACLSSSGPRIDDLNHLVKTDRRRADPFCKTSQDRNDTDGREKYSEVDIFHVYNLTEQNYRQKLIELPQSVGTHCRIGFWGSPENITETSRKCTCFSVFFSRSLPKIRKIRKFKGKRCLMRPLFHKFRSFSDLFLRC